jgi:hypothetical protein
MKFSTFYYFHIYFESVLCTVKDESGAKFLIVTLNMICLSTAVKTIEGW